MRRVPIKYGGYAVGYSNRTPSVRIEQDTYRDLRAYFLEMAVKRSRKQLEGQFRQLPLEPYAPVKRQLWALLQHTNARRKRAGMELLDHACLRQKRRVYRPFELQVPSPAPPRINPQARHAA